MYRNVLTRLYLQPPWATHRTHWKGVEGVLSALAGQGYWALIDDLAPSCGVR